MNQSLWKLHYRHFRAMMNDGKHNRASWLQSYLYAYIPSERTWKRSIGYAWLMVHSGVVKSSEYPTANDLINGLCRLGVL